ncbi:MAG: AAA family ATPase [archaeon]|nr:AAA family ATPase [archaeon]
MRITISGPPGSGKTTTCSRLSEILGFRAVVFGNIFREMAADRHFSLLEFSDLAEKDPSIDKMIDDKILEIAKNNEDVILESRLSAYMVSRNSIPAFKIYLYASPEVRMRRIGMRERQPSKEVNKDTLKRQASESKRYMAYYGIDISDMSVYDLIINTDNLNSDEVVNTVLKAIESHKH